MLILSVAEVEPIGAAYAQAQRIRYRQQVFERRCSFSPHQRQQAIKACQKYLDAYPFNCLLVTDATGYTLWTYVGES
ncbi:MAG: hypothetical protein NZL92_00105 [Gloeomargarita sp. SKYG116]|nr:hypothetical protein [Gloeomargarita sp. SKYG116]MCS7225945.1 hypothetical protein [Gloeomargarita sp. SKYB31]MDW8400079.1 hypothetical protein [Gloeomargarita sp. SKYGB_i_bin116]